MSRSDTDLFPRRVIDHSDPPPPMPPPMENNERDYLFYLVTEMDKDLPAPPPPSPEYRTTRLCQPIDELLQLSKSDIELRRQRSHSMLEADTNLNIIVAQHPASRNSPLRQVSSQMDVDAKAGTTPSPRRRIRRDGSLILSFPKNRRITLPNPTGHERSPSASSSHGVSKPISRPTSPSFNIPYLRSTIHSIPCTTRASTPGRLRSPTEISPRLASSGRQISSPIISEQPDSPTFFSSPRPVTPCTAPQSRSESFSTRSSEPLRKDGLVSYFSDSEDEGKRSKRSSSSKKRGSFEQRGGSMGRGRRFRRTLSDTFGFLSCGTE